MKLVLLGQTEAMTTSFGFGQAILVASHIMHANILLVGLLHISLNVKPPFYSQLFRVATQYVVAHCHLRQHHPPRIMQLNGEKLQLSQKFNTTYQMDLIYSRHPAQLCLLSPPWSCGSTR